MSDKNNTGVDPAKGATASEPATQSAAGGKVNDKPNNPQMGLERFLQKSPQQNGITALLRIKHKAEVKTMLEWETVIKQLLIQKVQ